MVAQQPNLIVLRSAFVSSEVERAPALFLVHDLHPGAVRFTSLRLMSPRDPPACFTFCFCPHAPYHIYTRFPAQLSLHNAVE